MDSNKNWIEEIHKNTLSMRFKLKRSLFEGQSPFQKVQIVETEGHGKMLFNDGATMLSERDEAIYHDMITHISLFTHPNPKRVLIIGGGDGGTLRELLRHASVEECVMVEIDEMVVNACKEFIPQTANSMKENLRAKVLIEDGVKFVESAKTQSQKFDVVLVDSTDPIGPAQPLFGEEFYQNVSDCLSDQGIVVAQGESPYYELETQKSMLKNLRKIFKKTHIYNYANMVYPAGLWSFIYASKGLCPLKDFDPSRITKSGLDFYYYNEEIHRAAFQLPNFQKRFLKEVLSELPALSVLD